MTQFSANLGFLWTDLSLIDAIYKAKKHGFDAVEQIQSLRVARFQILSLKPG